MKHILILVTLDTKLDEAILLKRAIEEFQCEGIILDCSLTKSKSEYHALREEMFHRGNKTEDELLSLDKNGAHCLMRELACAQTEAMFEEDRIDGGIGMGGVQGTIIAAEALQRLPIGVPKFLFSAVANGNAIFGPYVGTTDMVIMHSVVDIAGTNWLIRKLIRHAAAAVTAMASVQEEQTQRTRTVAITMGGVTTPCVDRIRQRLEEAKYEVLVFHCNGIGAESMEELVSAGEIDAVMDITPHDVMDVLEGGLMPAAKNRYSSIVQAGIPVILAPGCADLILYNGVDQIPASKQGRKFVEHNSLHTHVKADYSEMYRLGGYICERLAQAADHVSVMVPLRGYSQQNKEGCVLYDPDADRGFYDALHATGVPSFRILPIDAHINDSAFAEACCDELERRFAELTSF